MSLTGWDATKKFSITIDAADVSADEVDFPHLLNIGVASGKTALDTTAVFTELGTSSLKIAVEDGDSGNQCYVEIEQWDSVNLTAQLWVKIPSLSSTVDIVVNLYYDSAQADNTTYVGVTTTVPAQNVWDAYFAGVYHMAQDPSGTAPQILDSTVNANHGTTHGTMTSADLVDGLIGKAINFDGVDDYIEIPYSSTLSLNGTAGLTLEFILSGHTGSYPTIAANDGGGSGYMARVSNQTALFFSSAGAGYNSPAGVLSTTAFDCVVYTHIGSAPTQYYVNGTSVYSYTIAAVPDTTSVTRIGRRIDYSYFYDGIIDEVRFSNVVRSANWNALTNLSVRDQLGTWASAAPSGASLSDTFTISENVLPLASLKASFSDNINLNESSIASLLLSLSDTLSFSESSIVLAHLKGSSSDTFNLSDSITVTAHLLGAVNDTITLTDNSNALLSAIAALSDIISLSDTISIPGSYTAAISDILSISDIQTSLASLKSFFSDTLNLDDILSVKSYSNLSDAFTLTDSPEALANFLVSIVDNINFSDSASGTLHLKINLSDTLTLSEHLLVLINYVTSLIDNLSLSDSVSGIIVKIPGEITITFSSSAPSITFS